MSENRLPKNKNSGYIYIFRANNGSAYTKIGRTSKLSYVKYRVRAANKSILEAFTDEHAYAFKRNGRFCLKSEADLSHSNNDHTVSVYRVFKVWAPEFCERKLIERFNNSLVYKREWFDFSDSDCEKVEVILDPYLIEASALAP